MARPLGWTTRGRAGPARAGRGEAGQGPRARGERPLLRGAGSAGGRRRASQRPSGGGQCIREANPSVPWKPSLICICSPENVHTSGFSGSVGQSAPRPRAWQHPIGAGVHGAAGWRQGRILLALHLPRPKRPAQGRPTRKGHACSPRASRWRRPWLPLHDCIPPSNLELEVFVPPKRK